MIRDWQNSPVPPIRLAIAALLLAASTSTVGEAAEFGTVLAEKSSLTFASRQMGVPVNGRFARFTPQVVFDPARPEAAQISVTVDIGSVDAGSKEANDEVVGKPLFNVRLFPTATFASTSVKAAGASGSGKFTATGTLTIKGKSQPVTAPFTFRTEGGNAVFDGSFLVKRIEFTVGEGAWTDVDTVANEVQVNFRVTAAPLAAVTKKAKQQPKSIRRDP